jgi:ABC-type branched-subunit amino acid transport system permease subunit
MNFTAWKIWGEANSWQRNWLPVIGAALVGFAGAFLTHDLSFVTTGAIAIVSLAIYVPIALLITFGPFHKSDLRRKED